MSERWSQWTKESELAFWASEPDKYYISRLWDKYVNFCVDSVISKHFQNRTIRTVMDVGGGKFGGALYFYLGTGKKILVDVLGAEFAKEGKIPSDVLICTSNFVHIPFVDNSVDILFAWEALDHALVWSHFQQGQKEFIRLLAPGGLLFVHIPLRASPDSFHIATPDANEIIEGFKPLRVIDNFNEMVPKHSLMHDQVFTILTKD